VPVSERTIGQHSWLLDALKAHVSSGAYSEPPRNTTAFLDADGHGGCEGLERSRKITHGTTTNPQSVVNPKHTKGCLERHAHEHPGVDPAAVARTFRLTWAQWVTLQVRAMTCPSPPPTMPRTTAPTGR
jgi:hypothetical protein